MNYLYKVIVESNDSHEASYENGYTEYIFTKEENANHCYNRLVKEYADDETITEEKLPDYCKNMRRFKWKKYWYTIYRATVGTDDENEENLTITEGQAREFYRDLKGLMYHGDTNHSDTGILYVFGVANWLDITEEKAKEICNAWVKYGITERQGGGIVI